MAKSTDNKGQQKRTVDDKTLKKLNDLSKELDLTAEPVIVKAPLQNGQYITQKFKKTGIFLHHTAGTSAKGAISWWDQTKERVGTPYVIDRDGTIYECFDPSLWAFHLGIVGDDNQLEKHTVNIELVSAGPLRDSVFYPLWPSKVGAKRIPEEDVHRTNFRGFKEWHKYSDAQIKSLCQLIAKIARDFPTMELPDKLPDLGLFDQSIIDEAKGGIWSHANVRKDKTDIFPQANLIKALNKTLKLIKKA